MYNVFIFQKLMNVQAERIIATPMLPATTRSILSSATANQDTQEMALIVQVSLIILITIQVWPITIPWNGFRLFLLNSWRRTGKNSSSSSLREFIP